MTTRTVASGLLSPAIHDTSLLVSTDLNSDAFASFGQVIQNPTTHGNLPKLESVNANQGSATKWLDVTTMHDFYDFSGSGKAAKLAMNMFVCRPRELEEVHGRMVFPIRILERHPFTAQSFIPLGFSAADSNVRYLVIVAPTLPLDSDTNPFTQAFNSTASTTSDQSSGPTRKGTGLPDLNNVKAFIARGDQAVTYGPGTWHAPMVVLGDKAIDFVVVQYSNDVANEDCQEYEIRDSNGKIGLAVNVGEAANARAKL